MSQTLLMDCDVPPGPHTLSFLSNLLSPPTGWVVWVSTVLGQGQGKVLPTLPPLQTAHKARTSPCGTVHQVQPPLSRDGPVSGAQHANEGKFNFEEDLEGCQLLSSLLSLEGSKTALQTGRGLPDRGLPEAGGYGGDLPQEYGSECWGSARVPLTALPP